jgi:hypothetical protein
MQIDYYVIEDMLYAILVRSYLEYSSPKVTVLENPDEDCWDIHICFPLMGKLGISTDYSLPIADINKKTLREVAVRLEQLAKDIKEDCCRKQLKDGKE